MVTPGNRHFSINGTYISIKKYASHEAIEKYCYLNTKVIECVSRVRFCNWFCTAMCSDNVDLLVTCLQTKHDFT